MPQGRWARQGCAPRCNRQCATSPKPLPAPTSGTTVDAATFDSIDGITPYIANDNFYRIDTALVVPKVDTDQWSLTIDGMVNTPLSFTYEELIEQSTTVETVTIACVSTRLVEISSVMPSGKASPQHSSQQAGIEQKQHNLSHSVDGFTAECQLKLPSMVEPHLSQRQ